MPSRMLKESICTSRNLDRLSDVAEAFFYRLVVQCDDHGRCTADPELLLAKVYPRRLHLGPHPVAERLDELVQEDIVVIYDVEGEPFLEMVTWTEHQRIRNKHSKYPGPEKGIVRDKPEPGSLRQLAAVRDDPQQLAADRGGSRPELEVELEVELSTPPGGRSAPSSSYSKRLANQLATEHGVKLEACKTKHAAIRSLLVAGMTHKPPEEHPGMAIGIICDYVQQVTGKPIAEDARSLAARQVRKIDPLEVLDAYGEALDWGAGIGEKHSRDPKSLAKYVTAILGKRSKARSG